MLIAFLLLATGTATAAAAPVARTASGVVRGSSSSGVDSFLGIPYAAPPIGDLRWRPPAAPASWTGVRDAVAYGNRCPAQASTNGPRSEDEDCLYLNVQRPIAADKLPVFVWIHGGGLVNGSSNQHDGSLIAKTNGVVVVTLNYRLGLFGFLAHPGLTAEAGQSGDYGFMDQQAALRWVRQNISAFGGDPAQVTLGGESAGGFSTCAHLASPSSRGLFQRAIIQSGSCISTPLPQAEQAGVTVAQSLGCADVACLRALPASRLVDASTSASLVSRVPVLPRPPDTAVRTGDFGRVPLMVGANRDEGRTFAQGFVGATREQYESWVTSTFDERVLSRYPWPSHADQFTAAYLIGAIMTDSGLVGGIGGCSTSDLVTTFAGWTRTYAYQFDHRTGPGLAPTPGYVWGAGHAAELAYLWPSFDNGTPIAPTFDASERRLSADMVRYWGSFIRSGRPFAPGSSPWPAYNGAKLTLSLRAGGASVPISYRQLGAEHNCDLWRSLPQAGGAG
ncbi:carboxylesterase family protein [Amycolatopsis acidiphila]|uniref:Carboxylic ester hydrolase n=1 Tax=Amycolatopsis acidiphila TaxID=715473 RepID=A0A558A3W9_9PSEU|nr:carboxylesterase family protein [Amycolatopsis acidiphila]